MIINPVTVVYTESTWMGLEAGILVDAIGEQYRFLSDQTSISEGRVLIDYRSLPGLRMLWVSQIYDKEGWQSNYDGFNTD